MCRDSEFFKWTQINRIGTSGHAGKYDMHLGQGENLGGNAPAFCSEVSRHPWLNWGSSMQWPHDAVLPYDHFTEVIW